MRNVYEPLCILGNSNLPAPSVYTVVRTPLGATSWTPTPSGESPLLIRTTPVAPPLRPLCTGHFCVSALYAGFSGGFSPSAQHFPEWKYARRSAISASDRLWLNAGMRGPP